jgi:alkylation response protein AidB-like acyl-CoA dehydrogenase
MFTGGAFLVSPLGEHFLYSPENFSEEHIEFARTAEKFALKKIYPVRDRIESFDKKLVLEIFRQCGEMGFLACDIPEEYGGMALDKIASTIFAEKISYGQSSSFAVTFSAHTGIGTLPIVFFGNQAQKEKYLPKLATGEWLSAYALTEANSGSDALSVQTTASLSEDGSYYLLNGSKQFISNGSWADLLITFGKVNGKKLSCFLVDPKSQGVILHEEKNKLGLRGSSTANIIFENVKVSTDDLLGQVGNGTEIALNTLNIGRFKLGASVLGGCKAVINESVNYALGRKQFGQPVAYFDALKKKVADMTIRTYALESIVYATAGLLDKAINLISPESTQYYREVASGIEKFALECSICKVYGSEALWLNTDDGLQIFGGYGFSEDYPLAKMTRDTRIDRIYEGTNEINRQIILGYLIKKTLLEELPIREKIKEIPGILKIKNEQTHKNFFSEGKQALKFSKYLFLYLFNEVLIKFGQDLLNEQQIGELLSDFISDIFILDATLSRLIIAEDRSNITGEVLSAIGSVLFGEKMLGFNSTAKKILGSLHQGQELKNALKILNQFENKMFLNINIFNLKKKIADFIYQKKKYPI